MNKNKCDIGKLVGAKIDPYSKGGKAKITKANCSISSIYSDNGVIFFVGQNISKEVVITSGYFSVTKEFDETKNSWSTSFAPVISFNSDKILITDSGGPKQSGILITPEKGLLVSRALDKVKIMNEGL